MSNYSGYNEKELSEKLENKTLLSVLGKRSDDGLRLEDIDPNAVINDRGSTLLHLCVKYNKVLFASYLILEKCNVDIQDANGDTPLILALKHYRMELVSLLLDARANIYLTNNDGESALHLIFLKKGFDFSRFIDQLVKRILSEVSSTKELMELLLKHNCPIYHVVRFRKYRIIKTMVERGCDINASDFVSGTTALHEAAKLGSLRLVKVLLDLGADVNITDREGAIPFDRINYEHEHALKIAKLLMPDKFEWNDLNHDGKLKLYWIFANGNKDALGLFLKKYRIDCHARDFHGNTLLHYLMENSNCNVLDLFPFTKFEVNALNDQDATALRIAAERGAPIPVIQYLLKNGADVNNDSIVRNIVFETAQQMIKPPEYKREVFNLYLKYGLDVNRPIGRYGTLLHIITSYGNERHLEICQDAKFNMNVLHDDATALHMAVIRGNYRFVSWLLERGAHTDITDHFGNTPLFTILSRKKKDETLECIAILLAYGAKRLSKWDRIWIDAELIDRQINVIDKAQENGMLSVMSPVVAHIATLVELKILTNQRIVAQVSAIPELKRQYDEFKQWIKNARTVMVRRDLSLFRIMTEDSNNITNYVKPNVIFKEVLDTYGKDLNLYFKFTLERRYSLAQKINDLQEAASHIVSECIGLFDPTHIVVEKIVSFLKMPDLKLFA